jgi:hypothetical protein
MEEVQGRFRRMPTTDIARPPGSVAVEEKINELPRGGPAFRQAESGDYEISANNLNTLLRRELETPTRDIDNLIGELEILRKKLQTDANRIERDIVEYAELSQHVMQLTTIISQTVKKIRSASDIG